MVKPVITPVHKEFENQVKKSFELLRSINDVKTAYTRSTPRISQKDVNLVVELSFLKIFLAWEQFLENSFLRYMLGGETARGFKPKRCVFPYNLDHALKIVSEGKDYPKWETPSDVIRKSDLFFRDGKPFKDSLYPIIGKLNDMQTIRNSIVHMSSNSQEKFKSLVRNEMNYAPKNISPGRFLLSNKTSLNPPVTYFQFYSDILMSTSKKIVP